MEHSNIRILEINRSDLQSRPNRAKGLLFADPASLELLAFIERIAPSEAPVLICGETGTGKELAARHIHELSGRTGPFVAVNCGAISETLAESEWFGHEQSAFTGAVRRREGWFEAANGGTLFLDEIGVLPPPMQVKLLRVLQEREVVRVGSVHPVPVDVRLVAATNNDLQTEVQAGRFRLDLFYRLNIAQLKLPSLRDRPGDVLPLAQHFLERYRRRLGLPERRFTLPARLALERYAWPGNIRELENVVHFALLLAPGHEIGLEHLKLNGSVLPGVAAKTGASEQSPQTQIAQALRQLLESPTEKLFVGLEKLVVDEAFRYNHCNQVRTAAQLGISRNVLRTLLKKHGYLGDRC